ncbi:MULTISPECIES: hypothetical protein [Xanthobacter]|uniref:hypothetical protein n=1 Tax=Xanthobacter TaxID=279 RepID=UPI001F2EA91E|nr:MULTISPECIES: hypothetical protein [unclassified Xanthobacter]
MRILSVLSFLLCGGASTAVAYSPEMTLDFTWIGIELCAPSATSPEFQLANVPAGTVRLRFVLTNSNNEALGANDVPLPASGTIPRGAVPFKAPCSSGMYTWSVEALGGDDHPLARAQLARPYY